MARTEIEAGSELRLQAHKSRHGGTRRSLLDRIYAHIKENFR